MLWFFSPRIKLFCSTGIKESRVPRIYHSTFLFKKEEVHGAKGILPHPLHLSFYCWLRNASGRGHCILIGNSHHQGVKPYHNNKYLALAFERMQTMKRNVGFYYPWIPNRTVAHSGYQGGVPSGHEQEKVAIPRVYKFLPPMLCCDED